MDEKIRAELIIAIDGYTSGYFGIDVPKNKEFAQDLYEHVIEPIAFKNTIPRSELEGLVKEWTGRWDNMTKIGLSGSVTLLNSINQLQQLIDKYSNNT